MTELLADGGHDDYVDPNDGRHSIEAHMMPTPPYEPYEGHMRVVF